MEGRKTDTDGLRGREGHPVARARELSAALKDFHRALIHSEIGNDPSLDNPYTTLFALINHPHYAWMGVLSRLITRIDQHVDEGETADPGLVRALFDEASGLLDGTGADATAEFRMRYVMALQKEPEVGLATGRLRRVLAARPGAED
jgi:hypothetical protein